MTDGGQGVADLPAGGPDRGPLQQHEKLEGGPPLLGYPERSLTELFGLVQVTPLQGKPGQCAQLVDREEMPVEAKALRLRPGLLGRLGGLAQVAGLKQASACAPGTITSLTGSLSSGATAAAAASRSTAA